MSSRSVPFVSTESDSNNAAALEYLPMSKYSKAALYFASASLLSSISSYWDLQEAKETTASIEIIKSLNLEASLNSTGGTVFTTIPYDEGWQVTVDGENVNCYAWEKTFLAFDVTEGSHEVKFTYIPPGFQEGCTISLVGILVTILLLIRKKEKLEKQA